MHSSVGAINIFRRDDATFALIGSASLNKYDESGSSTLHPQKTNCYMFDSKDIND